MTILLSLAKVLKVRFFFVFFFSFPITSDFEGEHGYLEQGMGTWIQHPYTVPQNERVLGDHVIDKLLKSHDCQIRKNLEICHHLQTLYSESYSFVISPLPEKESNRLFIRRKKCVTCITIVAIAAIYNLPTGFIITLVFSYTSLVISRLYSSFFCRRFTLHFCAVVHRYGAINLIILAIFKSCFV